MTRARLVWLFFGAAVALGACGDGTAAVVAPQPVDASLVPASVLGDAFAFHETALPVKKAFAEVGPKSLAADGRLWELRKADRLVGVLQLTTLLPEVDLLDKPLREAIVKQLLPTSRDHFEVGDVAVWSSESQGKTSYVWFGDGLLALMTVKPGANDALEPEVVLGDVLDHMVAARAWQYVYFDDDEATDA
jgi:hypothetical protein